MLLRSGRRSPWTILGAGTVLAVVASGLIAAPGATAQDVRQESGTTAAGPTPPRPVDPATVVTFTIGLKRPEQAARNALRDIADPRSAKYRHFLTRNAIMKRFGPDSGDLDVIRTSAQQAGLTLRVDDSGVFALVSGKAKDMEAWVNSPISEQQQQTPPSGLVSVRAATDPQLPTGVRSHMSAFMAQDFQTTYPDKEQPIQATAQQQPAFSGVNKGTARSCVVRVSKKLNKYVYSYNELRKAYGISRLPSSAKIGRNSRVTIIAQGSGFSTAALHDSAECFDRPGVQAVRTAVTGFSGILPEGDEGDLDIQIAQAVLPAKATVSVLESSGLDVRNFLSYATAYSMPQLPDVITSSYGTCEQSLMEGESAQSRILTEAILLRLAMAGTSAFSAAGDSGSSDCVNDGVGPKRLAVDYEPSSHFVTAVGGSRIILDSDNTRKNEVVWNDRKLEPPIGSQPTGGGGGRSRLFHRPWWQPYSMNHSKWRGVPDLAVHASAGPGWPLFMGTQGDLEPVSGTSAASPFTASAFGIMAARERIKGHPPLGQVQPLLYLQRQWYPKTFFDIVAGNNDVFHRGCCTAEPGYDKASGLGAPRLHTIWRHLLPQGHK